jgi:hypothetical protein
LLSTCAGVADVRPVETVNMPGNAKSEDLKLGTAVLQEVKIPGFLGNRDAASRCSPSSPAGATPRARR